MTISQSFLNSICWSRHFAGRIDQLSSLREFPIFINDLTFRILLPDSLSGGKWFYVNQEWSLQSQSKQVITASAYTFFVSLRRNDTMQIWVHNEFQGWEQFDCLFILRLNTNFLNRKTNRSRSLSQWNVYHSSPTAGCSAVREKPLARPIKES